MSSHTETLLQAIHATLKLRQSGALEPDQVTALGAALGLSEADVYEHALTLRRHELIEFEWGGKVRITDLGIERLNPRPAAGSIQLTNSTYVGPGADVSGIVGNKNKMGNATAPDASAAVNSPAGVRPGELTAALVELRSLMQDLPEGAREQVEAIEAELVAAETEAREGGTTGTSLAQRLQSVQRVMERATAVAEQGKKLAGLARLLAPAFEWARTLLGS